MERVKLEFYIVKYNFENVKLVGFIFEEDKVILYLFFKVFVFLFYLCLEVFGILFIEV